MSLTSRDFRYLALIMTSKTCKYITHFYIQLTFANGFIYCISFVNVNMSDCCGGGKTGQLELFHFLDLS